MSDALPSEYGVNAHGPRQRAGMSRDQREWHERMASLPRTVHSKTQRDEMARQLRAADMSEALSRARKNSVRVEAGIRASKTRAGVTVSAVSQWHEDEIPKGRLWQLRALGCPESDRPGVMASPLAARR